jgi:hypothetical protein
MTTSHPYKLQWRDPNSSFTVFVFFVFVFAFAVTMTVLLTTCLEPGAVPLKGTKPGDAKPTTCELLLPYTAAGFMCLFGTGGDTPDGSANEKSSPKSEPEDKSMPPNLEAFISRECLPDIIDVYDRSTLQDLCSSLHFDCWDDFIARYPISFVREYPPRTPTNKGTFNPPLWIHPVHNVDSDGVQAMGHNHRSPQTVPTGVNLTFDTPNISAVAITRRSPSHLSHFPLPQPRRQCAALLQSNLRRRAVLNAICS